MIEDQLLHEMIRRGGPDCDRALRQLLNDRVVRGKLWRLVIDQAGGSADDASEILQTAIIRFYESVIDGKFEGRSQTRTFFIGFVRIRSLEWLRERGKTRLVSEVRFFDEKGQDESGFLIEKAAAEQDQNLEKRDSALAEIFGKLTEKCQKALADRFIELKEYDAIRVNLDYKTIQQARDKVYECRQRLRQILTENPSLRSFLKRTR